MIKRIARSVCVVLVLTDFDAHAVKPNKTSTTHTIRAIRLIIYFILLFILHNSTGLFARSRAPSLQWLSPIHDKLIRHLVLQSRNTSLHRKSYIYHPNPQAMDPLRENKYLSQLSHIHKSTQHDHATGQCRQFRYFHDAPPYWILLIEKASSKTKLMVCRSSSDTEK